MAGFRDHTEMDVYKLSEHVQQRVSEIVARPVFNRHLKLREQLSDASESPCPNIGEGFSRFYPRDNARFVRVAKSSLTEVMEHLKTALKKGLISEQEHDDVRWLAWRARKAATGYVRYLETATAPGAPPPKSRRPRAHLRTKPRGTRRNAEPAGT